MAAIKQQNAYYAQYHRCLAAPRAGKRAGRRITQNTGILDSTVRLNPVEA